MNQSELEPIPPRSAAPAFAAAGVALLLWSGTAIANKIAVNHMDDLSAGVLRSMIAGICALAFALLAKLPFPGTARERVLLIVSGLASFAFWPILLSLGIGRTTAGHAALIMATIPVFTVLIAALVERRRPQAGWGFGAAVAFAGTTAVVMGRGVSIEAFDDGSSIAGDLIILIGGVICAIGYVAGGKLSPKIGTAATTFWGLACALVVLVPTFAAIAGRTEWTTVPVAGWLAVGWMAFLSSLAGYALWFYALGRGGIARIGSLQLAMPVVTLFAAALVLHETLTPLLLVSCATIVVGTFVAQRNAP